MIKILIIFWIVRVDIYRIKDIAGIALPHKTEEPVFAIEKIFLNSRPREKVCAAIAKKKLSGLNATYKKFSML